MKLFYSPFHTFVHKVLVTAHECGHWDKLERVATFPFKNNAGEDCGDSYDISPLNPLDKVPTLVTDDGQVIFASQAICEYLEECHPAPALIGTSAEERAMTRMWTRRIDLYIVEPMLTGFRSAEGQGLFKSRMRLIPQAAADLKALAQEKIAWLDGLIAGRDFIAGDSLTLADILLYCTLDFGATVGQPFSADNANIAAWFARVNGRSSAEASRK